MNRVAQVVPDLPTFAVDDGFSYAVPAGMELGVGSIVRVPLGGRRVRGWVTAVRTDDRQGLKDVIGVSGARPIFHEGLLQTLRWAAVHYVSPLAAILPKAAPPNLPKVGRVKHPEPMDVAGSVPPAVAGIAATLGEGGRPATTFLAGAGPWSVELSTIVGAAAAQSRGSLVVVPTAAECLALAEELGERFGSRVVAATSSGAAVDRTRGWSQAAGTAGTIVVGTPEVALWPVADLGVAVIVGEGRRAMKARQTPTVHVRDLIRRRAAVERFGLIVMGHVPTLETFTAGIAVKTVAGRAWPLVEIVDRTEEPPGVGLLADGTRTAIAGAMRRSEPVFVFVSRRGFAPAFRCTNCGELRRCPRCGSNPGQGTHCERCQVVNGPCQHCAGSTFLPLGAAAGRVVQDLGRLHGPAVTPAGQGGQIQVGTERDIPIPGSVALSVVVDADSMLLRPHYRAEEDTLGVLARVAGAVRRGRGHRCVVQSRMPAHRVLQALRHGDGSQIAPEWLREREADQLPPFGELLALELTGAPLSADAELRAVVDEGVAVFGPAEAGEALRWLIQAPDLRRSKIQLREQVQSWRDRGAKVRVDADPLDV